MSLTVKLGVETGGSPTGRVCMCDSRESASISPIDGLPHQSPAKHLLHIRIKLHLNPPSFKIRPAETVAA